MISLRNTKQGASVQTRHFERATLLVKRAALLNLVVMFLISTNFMVADIFTKATEKSTFITMRGVLMNSHVVLRHVLDKALFGLHGRAHRLCEHLCSQLSKSATSNSICGH